MLNSIVGWVLFPNMISTFVKCSVRNDVWLTFRHRPTILAFCLPEIVKSKTWPSTSNLNVQLIHTQLCYLVVCTECLPTYIFNLYIKCVLPAL